MKSSVLHTRSSDERHTEQNIAAQLQAATEEWGILDKVTAGVHDNASNIVLANQQWESVPCSAHTLQLAVNDGFKVGSAMRVVGACGKLVSHFHHSTVTTAGLKRNRSSKISPEINVFSAAVHFGIPSAICLKGFTSRDGLCLPPSLTGP